MRHPLGVVIERAAQRHDRRWRWRDGAMEWWNGMDLIYCPALCAIRRWRKNDWSVW